MALRRSRPVVRPPRVTKLTPAGGAAPASTRPCISAKTRVAIRLTSPASRPGSSPASRSEPFPADRSGPSPASRSGSSPTSFRKDPIEATTPRRGGSVSSPSKKERHESRLSGRIPILFAPEVSPAGPSPATTIATVWPRSARSPASSAIRVSASSPPPACRIQVPAASGRRAGARPGTRTISGTVRSGAAPAGHTARLGESDGLKCVAPTARRPVLPAAAACRHQLGRSPKHRSSQPSRRPSSRTSRHPDGASIDRHRSRITPGSGASRSNPAGRSTTSGSRSGGLEGRPSSGKRVARRSGEDQCSP